MSHGTGSGDVCSPDGVAQPRSLCQDGVECHTYTPLCSIISQSLSYVKSPRCKDFTVISSAECVLLFSKSLFCSWSLDLPNLIVFYCHWVGLKSWMAFHWISHLIIIGYSFTQTHLHTLSHTNTKTHRLLLRGVARNSEALDNSSTAVLTHWISTIRVMFHCSWGTNTQSTIKESYIVTLWSDTRGELTS